MFRKIQQQIGLRLGNTNPFKIRDEYKTLNINNPKCELTFKEKLELNQDQYILRFALPDQNKCLGHLIGQHVLLQLDSIKKPYVPISAIDQVGVADFMIKKIQKHDMNQSLSDKLLNMKEGNKVTASGPITQFIYQGYGDFEIKDIIKRYRYVGMISHSTSFLSCYSLIERIAAFNDDTSLSLLWVHQHEKDIVFLNEFNDFVQRRKLNLNIMLENLDKDWVGPVGAISQDHIKKYMPPPRDDTLILIYGYKSFVDKSRQICQNAGYKNLLY